MKKTFIISGLLIIALTICIFVLIRNKETTVNYNEFVDEEQNHDDVIETIDEDINISLVDIESIPEDILAICIQQCRDYCIANGIQNETFMYYDSNDTEYVFKSVTTDTYITVYIGG